MSINRVMISGNLTRDAELRTTPSGTSILSFGVAVNDRRRTADGNWEDYANFIDCTMFGRRASAVAQYLKKGLKVAIEGRLHYSSWEDRNSGQRRSKVDVTVDELEFMSSRNGANQSYDDGGNNYGGQGGSYDAGRSYGDVPAQQSPVGNMPEPAAPNAYDDSDIPF
jgi:single-strand DNA-binding protein